MSPHHCTALEGLEPEVCEELRYLSVASALKMNWGRVVLKCLALHSQGCLFDPA